MDHIESQLQKDGTAKLKNAYGRLVAERTKDDAILSFTIPLKWKGHNPAGEHTWTTYMKAAFDTLEIAPNQLTQLEFLNFMKPDNSSKKLKNVFKDFVADHFRSSQVAPRRQFRRA